MIGISLGMDAMLVSVACSLEYRSSNYKLLFISFIFGFFQFIMPILGYIFSMYFNQFMYKYNDIVSSIIFLMLGLNMIIGCFKKDRSIVSYDLSIFNIFILSIATSMDALMVGFTFTKQFIFNSIIIGLVTFIMCFIGIIFGRKISTINSNFGYILGGLILIGLGVKILIL